MKAAKYIVKLSDDERAKLEDIRNKGIRPVRQIKRANILLGLDELSRYVGSKMLRPTQEAIAYQCQVSVQTVRVIAKQYVEEGLEATITRKKRETPPVEPIVTGDIEARIIALACGTPPEGYNRWTLRLLESKVVELGIIDQISDTTIYRLLKKRN